MNESSYEWQGRRESPGGRCWQGRLGPGGQENKRPPPGQGRRRQKCDRFDGVVSEEEGRGEEKKKNRGEDEKGEALGKYQSKKEKDFIDLFLMSAIFFTQCE